MVKLHAFYRHFKGGLYYVEGFARHTETGEMLVIYVAAGDRFDDEAARWARPMKDHEKAFTGQVDDNTPRFTLVDGADFW